VLASPEDWSTFSYRYVNRIYFGRASSLYCIWYGSEVRFPAGIRYVSVRDIRHPLRSRWDWPSSGILRSVQWWFLTDASGQIISPIFKDRWVVKKCRQGIATKRCILPQKSADLKRHLFSPKFPERMSGPIQPRRSFLRGWNGRGVVLTTAALHMVLRLRMIGAVFIRV
jgi:hypothetical protein